MKCLECLENAIHSENWNNIPIYTCKNGHRNGNLPEENKEEIKTRQEAA